MTRRCRLYFIAAALITLTALWPANLSAQPFIYGMNAADFCGLHVNNYAYQIDVSTGNVTQVYNLSGCEGRGIAKVGNCLYYTSGNSNGVSVYDLAGGGSGCLPGFTINKGCPINGLASITYDGVNFWTQDYNCSSKEIFKYNTLSKSQSTIILANCLVCDALEFVRIPGKFGGQGVLIANRGDHTGPYDVYDTSGKLIAPSFINPGSTSPNPTGIAWDGTYFYISDIYNRTIQKWDKNGSAVGPPISLTGYSSDQPPAVEDLAADLPPTTCDQPPNTTMVAWYPFDTPPPSAPFTSPNIASGNTGIWHWDTTSSGNGPPITVAGEVDKGLSFNGVDQYVESIDSIATNFGPANAGTCDGRGDYSTRCGDFSIDTWFMGGSFGDSVIVDKRSGTPPAIHGYALSLTFGTDAGHHSFAYFTLQLADGGAGLGYTNYLSPSIPSLPSGWHHFAVTVNRTSSTGIVMYLDGEQFSQADPTDRQLSLVNNTPMRIATNYSNTPPIGFFGGALDELEIFNRALSPDEVLGIVAAGPVGKCKRIGFP